MNDGMNSKEIALVASLSALSVVLSILPLYYPFPPIPFLKFDIAEVPIVLIALMTNPISTIVSCIVVGSLITLREGDPIGAFFKLLSLISTYTPLAVLKKKGKLISGSVSIGVRTIAMVLANYYLIPVLYTPGQPIEKLVELLGLSLPMFLLLVGIFNAIQATINILLGFYIYTKIPSEWKQIFGASE